MKIVMTKAESLSGLGGSEKTSSAYMEEEDFEFEGDESFNPPEDIDPAKLEAKK